MRIVSMALATVALVTAAWSQTSPGEPDIRRRLEMIERGQADAVSAELPQLMTAHQNHPGVIYLQGVLTPDGTEAAKIYQNIVDNFPKDEWADDALYRLYQYYTSVGLYKTAEQKIAQLKLEYPFSTYASEGTTVRPTMKPAPAAAEPKRDAPVTMTTPGTVPVPKFAAAFTVQVGAFSALANAEELKRKFEKEGFTSNIFTITRGTTKLHKVWVGEFPTIDEAKRFAGEIKKQFGLEAIAVSR
ncbi:MAG: SPOR domain-containing protein [Bacteroidetes bacterium]|jgi:cell division septation protein DedD|nr:SPOR domain-containing protein [Bacteroidota bacterium]